MMDCCLAWLCLPLRLWGAWFPVSAAGGVCVRGCKVYQACRGTLVCWGAQCGHATISAAAVQGRL